MPAPMTTHWAWLGSPVPVSDVGSVIWLLLVAAVRDGRVLADLTPRGRAGNQAGGGCYRSLRIVAPSPDRGRRPGPLGHRLGDAVEHHRHEGQAQGHLDALADQLARERLDHPVAERSPAA